MAEAATRDTLPPLTSATMRDRYVRLMKDYAALRGKPTPDLLARIVDFQTRVAALGTSLAGSDARAEAQATINYWQTVRINAGERPDTVLIADFDHEAARREAGDKPPYKGLAPFQTGDSGFFFSRFKLVNDLTDMVKSKRLLALVGLSGSGKSSVIRAGLIPNLAGSAYDGIDDDGLTDSGSWFYPQPVLPGVDPVAALEARFGRTVAAPADLVAALDANGTAVLLAIDQFEEVFTLSDPGPRRTLFLDALVAAATTGVHRHVVVITMRSEYKGKVIAHDAFNTLFKAGCREVEAMQPSELRKVIEEPAQRLGVGFEPGLIEELLARVQGEPAGLPLLSFTLLKLWEKRDGGAMKRADYEALGGTPRDILAKSADAVFLGFTLQQDRDLVEGIFARLAKVGDGFEATSSRVKRAELGVLVAQDSDGGAIDSVLGKLVDAGLIRTSPTGAMTPTTEIEVAHEALIRNWGRLTEWVREDFAKQTNRRAFTLRAEKWAAGAGDLVSGISLDEAQDFPDQSAIEQKYIAASLRRARYLQRRFWVVIVALAGLVLLLVIALYFLAGFLRQNAADQRLANAMRQADALIERGETRLAKTVMLAALGDGEALPPVMAAALQAAVLNEVDESFQTAPGAGAAKGLSLDGALMTLWEDGKARIWRTRADKPLLLAVPGRLITAAALSPDNRHAVTASIIRGDTADKPVTKLEIWTLSGTSAGATARFKSVADLLTQDIGSIKYSPDGKQVVLASKSRQTGVHDAESGELAAQVGPDTGATSAVFSPDGDRILLADTQGGVNLYALDGSSLLNPIHVDKDFVTTARFSQSGARFVVGTDKGKLAVYNSETGENLLTLPGHAKGVTGVAFSPDSSMIVSGSKDGTLRLWEHGIAAGRLLRTIRTTRPGAATSAVNAVAFGDSGATIVAARENGTISVLDLTGKKLVRKGQARNETRLAPEARFGLGSWRALSTSAHVIATLGQSADPGFCCSVAAWQVGNDRPTATVETRQQPYDVMMSEDGRRLAVLEPVDDGVAISIVATRGGALQTGKPIVVPAPSPDETAGENGKDVPIWSSLSADGSTMIIVMESSRLVAWRGGDTLVDIAVRRDHPLAVDNGGLIYVDLPIEFSKGGPMRFALSAQGQPMVAIHDGKTGALSARIRATGHVEAFVFSPDGRTMFVGSADGSGAIYDTATGALRVRLDGRHSNAIGHADFSDDGTTLVTTSIDGTARLWRAGDGRLLHVLASNDSSIADATFSNDGKRLITGAENRIATLWDVATGKPLTVLPGPLKSGAITGWFSPDDKRAITLSDDTTLRRWNIATPAASHASLRRDACKDGGLTAQEARDAGLDSSAQRVCSRLSERMIETLRLRR